MITKQSVKKLPSGAGVYIFYEVKKPIYIGKAINIRARTLSHLQNSVLDSKEASIINKSTRIEAIETTSEFDAIILEAKLINQHKPKYNLVLRDDKSLLYIKVTTYEKYPKIFPVRREFDKKSRYFGPFESAKLTYYIIRQLRKIVPFCTQSRLTGRTCFYSKIGLCNPCPNIIWKMEDGRLKEKLEKKYRENINQAIKILDGRGKNIVEKFEKDLSLAVENEDFEKGISLRNKLFLFQKFLLARSFYSERLIHNKDIAVIAADFVQFMEKNFKVLIAKDRLKNFRIECYDISSMFGKERTGSMVVFEGGLSVKDQYRRFQIKGEKNLSDFAMLREVFERRFAKNSWRNPDLIVVDGGRPQLRQVSTVLNEKGLNIAHIGIVKRPDRIVFPMQSKRSVKLGVPRALFNLICEARDEAHRFAKKYHLFLRSQKIMV